MGESMETRKCIQCGKNFTISDSEKQFFDERKLHYPKRCKKCREENRQQSNDNYRLQPKKKKNNHLIEKILILGMLLLVAVGIVYVNKEAGTDKAAVTQEASYSSTQAKSTYVQADTSNAQASAVKEYQFRDANLLQEHFGKHGGEFGYTSTNQYVIGANAVIHSPDALHKTESQDGDDVYYLQATNEFVVLSTEGFIRTYFKPDDGIVYYNKQ